MKSKLTRFKERYLIQLGRIVVNMNLMELNTVSGIFLLTAEHQTLSESGSILLSIIGNQRFGKLLDALDTVVKTKVKNPRIFKEFARVKARAMSAYARRNVYVHSMWLFAEDDSFVSRMRNLGFPKIEQEFEPSVKDLSDLANELEECAWELLGFVHKIKEELKRRVSAS